MVSVYYCLGYPSNTILLGDLKYYFSSQMFTSEPLEHYDFVDPQGHYWRSPYRAQKNLYYIQIYFVKIYTQMKKYYVVPTICGISKHYLPTSPSIIWLHLTCKIVAYGKERLQK